MSVRARVYLDGAIAGIIGAAIVAFYSYSWTQSLDYLFTRLLYWEPDFSWEQKISLQLKKWRFL